MVVLESIGFAITLSDVAFRLIRELRRRYSASVSIKEQTAQIELKLRLLRDLDVCIFPEQHGQMPQLILENVHSLVEKCSLLEKKVQSKYRRFFFAEQLADELKSVANNLNLIIVCVSNYEMATCPPSQQSRRLLLSEYPLLFGLGRGIGHQDVVYETTLARAQEYERGAHQDSHNLELASLLYMKEADRGNRKALEALVRLIIPLDAIDKLDEKYVRYLISAHNAGIQGAALFLAVHSWAEYGLDERVYQLLCEAEKDHFVARIYKIYALYSGQGVQRDKARALRLAAALRTPVEDKLEIFKCVGCRNHPRRRRPPEIGFCLLDTRDLLHFLLRASLYCRSADVAAYTGNVYAKGIGLPRNMMMAIYVFEKGSRFGSHYCNLQLAQIYETGNGIPRNSGMASYYYGLVNIVEKAQELSVIDRKVERPIESTDEIQAPENDIICHPVCDI